LTEWMLSGEVEDGLTPMRTNDTDLRTLI
jgi:hypothetical protein